MENKTRYRDLTVLPLTDHKQLVIACDSSAGLGMKPYDQVKVTPDIMAACCVRVPLLELLCVGAKPITVVDVIGNEYNPTGKSMLQGVQSELSKANLAHLPLNGSTEENMTTYTSSIGLTVVGEVSEPLVSPTISHLDGLFQLGEPYVGNEVVSHLSDLCSYEEVRQLRAEDWVIDLLPVGSKGIGYEGNLLAKENQLKLTLEPSVPSQESAGPATVVLVVVKQAATEQFQEKYPNIKKIGTFYAK